jgi:hypothetical protein
VIEEGKGLEIDFIDFTRGLEGTVLQTATLLGQKIDSYLFWNALRLSTVIQCERK